MKAEVKGDGQGRFIELTPPQRRLLSHLAAMPGWQSVGQISTDMDIHPNSARGSLDALYNGGFVRRMREETGRRGRPSWLYQAVAAPAEQTAHDQVRMLTSAFESVVAHSDDPEREIDVFARSLSDQYELSREPGTDVIRSVVDYINSSGFDSVHDGEGRISLRHCPFRELYGRPPSPICGVHARVLRDLMPEGAHVDVYPLIEPGRCDVVVHLDAYSEGMARLEPGMTAPDFTLESTHGTLSLADLRESSEAGIVIYFYPKASTPGCTTEACDFRDSKEALAAAGYSIVGISPDPLEALTRFEVEEELNFPLASDPDHAVLEAYGAWGEKKNYGKVVVGVIRSTIIVDRDGIVRDALYNVKATGHVGRVTKNLIG